MMKTITQQNAGHLTSLFDNRVSAPSLINIIKHALLTCVILLALQLQGQGQVRPVFAPQFTYTGPQVYTVGTYITPLTPTNTGGAVPAPGTYNNPKTMVTAASNQIISGVTTDTYGDVYFGTGTIPTDHSNVRMEVDIINPDSAARDITASFFYGSYISITTDPENNIFMNNGEISEAPNSSNTIEAAIPISREPTASDPDCIAASAAGFIYKAEGSRHLITEFVRGIQNQAPITFSSALSDPVGVTVDAAGNVYAVDNTLPYVTEFKTNGTVIHIGTGLSNAWGIVVDAAGNLFVADSGNGVIKEYPAGGSAFISIGPGTANALAFPKDVAVDAADNLYIIDWGANNNARTLKYMQRFTGYAISPALPAGLSLNGATGEISGTPTQISPATTYTISAVNGFGTGSTTLTITTNPSSPSFSYSSPHVFDAGIAITPLSPTKGNGVTAIAYGDSTSNAMVIDSFFYQPAVAVDNNGNIFITDYRAHTVYKKPAGGGAHVVLSSAFLKPASIALDQAGNIYIGDEGDGTVKKMPTGGGTPVTIASGFVYPDGLAVDAAGNVYVSDQQLNTVTKIPAGGGPNVNIGSGFSDPIGLALDGTGNLYVSDSNNNQIVEIPANGGNAISIGAGSIFPVFIAVDGAGNLYYNDYIDNTLKFIAPGAAPVTISTAVFEIYNLAINGAGNIYVGDGNNGVLDQINPTGGFFVGPNLPAGLAFNSTTGVISGTPTTTQAATNYTVTGYNVTASAAATISIAVTLAPIISYQTPKTYTLGSAITPLTPASSNVSPQGYSSSSADVNLGVTFDHYPSCLSVDGAGDLYVAESDETFVIETYKNNSSAPITINTGFQNPSAMYVDAENFIYLCNPTANSIVRVGPAGGGVVTLYSGLNNPSGITLDASGNIYEADYGSNTVNRFPAAGGTPVAYGTGFSHPEGLAFDAAGNLYVVDSGNNALKEVLASDGSTITLVSGLNGPTNVALDPTGNIFIADHGNKLIKELPAGSNTPIAIGPTISFLAGLAVDQAGNVDVTAALHYAVEQIQPTGGYYLNARLPAGLALSNATGVISGTPTALSPATNYTITAYGNGYGVPANVNLAVVAAGNAQLSALTINAGTLSPAFNSTTNNYTVSVPYVQSSVKLTPTAAAAGSTITINGTTVASGATSGFLALKTGANTINVVVTAQNGVTTDTYTLTVTRAAASTNASLANVGISKGTLSPAFASGTTSYTVMETNGTASITLTPTTADLTATVIINGAAVKSGSASSAITLTVGTNVIPIAVTAQDGTTRQTYTINVIRPSTNAKLASLTINAGTLTPAFNTNTTSYTVSVPDVQSSVKLTPTVAVAGATVKINGTAVASGVSSGFIALKVGANTITTLVTAQDGVTTDSYTLTVTRAAASTNDNLSALTASKGTLSPAFAASTINYTDMVTNGTANVTLTPTTQVTTSTVTINGTAVLSGKASGAITLAVGSNTITTVVTAQDGTTKRTYTLNVIRPSANAKLSLLKISSGTLTPAFNTNTTAYTDAVTNATASVTVTPTVAVTGAAVKVNGITVTSGTSSAAIPLSVGSNKINIIVTAQDGVTIDTYTITVTRAGSIDNSVYEPVGVDKPSETAQLVDDDINIHQGVSPNGDGINDFLQIDNISRYPNNKLSIMNRNGQLVFEAKGYNNATKVFDGHSNKNGQMQLPGTYFYSLEYTVNGIIKHKTGFLVLKY